jgi:multidrug resistance protein, MATE family
MVNNFRHDDINLDGTNNSLLEPLLSSALEVQDVEAARETKVRSNETAPVRRNNGEDASTNPKAEFSVRAEVHEALSLGFPLAVSFFCRMGMASTDNSFVGHIRDEHYTPQTYLAAAVLSDMVVNVLITPPLAFNRVLNALVGQAMGSGNPHMAGIWLQQSMFWLTVSMAPCLIGFFYVEPILVALDFPPEIAKVAGVYAKFNVFWPIPNGLYQCMRFYFQAAGLPRPAMYNNIFFLFVNAMLNWCFVFGGPFRYLTGWQGFGFIGAAMSLSISRTLQSVSYFFYMFVYKQSHMPFWPHAGWSLKHHTASRTMEFMKQSVPNMGTTLFQTCASQATTFLVGRLGEKAIAASSALSTVTQPFMGTLSSTCSTITSVRVGYHLGHGDGYAAKRSAGLVLHFITLTNIFLAALFLLLRHVIIDVATDDDDVKNLSATLIPAMLVGSYLNLLVGTITSGVFSGMSRPLISTLLSFGFELPMSIGGVAVYILWYHGHLLGVYWWQVISGVIEVAVVLLILVSSNWDECANDAKRRQESSDTDTESDSESEHHSSAESLQSASDEEEALLQSEAEDEEASIQGTS